MTGPLTTFRKLKQFCSEDGCNERADWELDFGPDLDNEFHLSSSKSYCEKHTPACIFKIIKDIVKNAQTPPGTS